MMPRMVAHTCSGASSRVREAPSVTTFSISAFTLLVTAFSSTRVAEAFRSSSAASWMAVWTDMNWSSSLYSAWAAS